jgi:phytoene synthase
MIRKHSKSFYAAFQLLPNPIQRRGVFAVYAYCRIVDDAIDVDHDIKKLHHLKNELDQFVKGKVPSRFFWRALKASTSHFSYQESDFIPFYQLIEGQEFDAHQVRIPSLEQLEHYCDLVASSVGLMLLPMLAPGNYANKTSFAIHLGRAFQLTNILRDVGEDYRKDRIYLPASMMEAFQVNETMLNKPSTSAPLKALMKELIIHTRKYYDLARDQLSSFTKDVAFPLHVSLEIYAAILDVIEQKDYQILQQKHFVPTQMKKSILQRVQKQYA